MSKHISIFLILILTILFFKIDVAFGHTPHDNIHTIAISPNYSQDRTLLIIVRNKLLKSRDGGKSWKRIVKGLDNKHSLSSLNISSQFSKNLFLSSSGDGIYKSQDEGDSWFKVNQGLGSLNIDLVSTSPNSSDIALAAGSETGLYKTKNGGEIWYQVLNRESRITAIAFSPEQKKQILIGDNQGLVYKSSDEGEGWKRLFTIPNSGEIRAIAVSPNFSADKTLFVGTKKGGIFKTIDEGISFEKVNKGLSDLAIVSLAISPNYGIDSTVFASTWHQGVFSSNDGGNTWRKSSKGLTKDGQADATNMAHFGDLIVSPTFNQDRTIFLEGFNGLFKSTDGGSVWKEIDSTLSSSTIMGLGLSPDYRNDSTVAITTYLGGAYISQDQGDNWLAINKGLREVRRQGITRLFDIVFSPNYSSDKTLFSGIWKRFLISTNGGKHWNKVEPNDNFSDTYRFFRIAVSPDFASDNTIYLGVNKGAILRSTDGGKSFSVIGNVVDNIESLVISPYFSSDKTLYASVKGGSVYKTVDGGYTWQNVSNGIVLKEETIKIKLAISPNYQVDQTVFAGTAEGLFETKNGGKNWAKLSGTSYGGDAYIEAIAISPNYQSDQTFMVSVRGRGLFKTFNGGETFTEISKDLINNNHLFSPGFFQESVPIKFSPSYSVDQTIYGFSETELFKSTDGGNNWENIEIPASKYSNNYLTILYLLLTATPKRRFLISLIIALLSYLFLGYLPIGRKLSLRKWQIRSIGSFTAFIVVFILVNTFIV